MSKDNIGYDWELFRKNILKQSDRKNLFNDIATHRNPLVNTTLTAIEPTRLDTLIFGQECGIHPFPMPYYTRIDNKKDNNEDN